MSSLSDATDAELEDLPLDTENDPSFFKECGNAFVSNDSIQLFHSFGCDNKILDNIILLRDLTMVWPSGSFLTFFRADLRQMWFHSTQLGNQIGDIQTNNHSDILAIAEEAPSKLALFLYRWPGMTLEKELKPNSNEVFFKRICFSSCGKFLATLTEDKESQIWLTIWDIEENVIFYRSSVASLSASNIQFSKFLHGHLITSGPGYIQFWSIKKTFTGFKISGITGRVNYEQSSYNKGLLMLNDGKLITGTDQGNLLLWRNRIIILEISQPNEKPCHNGFINQILYENGDIITAGSDSWVRVWSWISISQVPSDETKVELYPLNEWHLGCLIFQLPKFENSQIKPSVWFSQDDDGSIWESHSTKTGDRPKRLILTRSRGPIAALVSNPNSSETFATLGADQSHIQIFHIPDRILVTRSVLSQTPGSALVWLPAFDDHLNILIAGCCDGTIYIISYNIIEFTLTILKTIKPHSQPIVDLTFCKNCVISTSLDCTVFILELDVQSESKLLPKGWFQTPSPLVKIFIQSDNLIGSCQDGDLLFTSLLSSPSNVPNSFELQEQICRVYSIYVKCNETFIIPKDYASPENAVKDSILWIISSFTTCIWFGLQSDGQQCCYEWSEYGALKKYTYADTLKSSVCSAIQHSSGCFLLFAHFDGYLSIQKLHHASRNIEQIWSSKVHTLGCKINLTFDLSNCFFISAGQDGNLFVFQVSNDLFKDAEKFQILPGKIQEDANSKQIYQEELTLQEILKKSFLEQKRARASKYRETVHTKMYSLQQEYRKIKKWNALLSPNMRLKLDHFNRDPRVEQAITAHFALAKATWTRSFGYERESSRLVLAKVRAILVEPVSTMPFVLSSIRNAGAVVFDKTPPCFKVKHPEIHRDPFVRGLRVTRLETQKRPELKRLIVKYSLCKVRAVERRRQKQQMDSNRPSQNRIGTKEIKLIENSQKSIGNYIFKIAASDGDGYYPRADRGDVFSHCKLVLETKRWLFEQCDNYNRMLSKLRIERNILHNTLGGYKKRINLIHDQIPRSLLRYTPSAVIEQESIEPWLKSNKPDKAPPPLPKWCRYRGVDLYGEEVEEVSQELMPLPPGSPDREMLIHLHNDPVIVKKRINQLKRGYFQYTNGKTITQMEMELYHHRQQKLVFEQRLITNLTDGMVTEFDLKCLHMRNERIQMESSLINRKLNLIHKIQELCIFHKFEDKERHLEKELIELLNEKKSIKKRISEEVEQLTNHEMKVKDLKEARNDLDADFEYTIAEEYATIALLRDIYFDGIICPEKNILCSPEILNITLQLREERRHLEEQIENEQILADGLQKNIIKIKESLKSIYGKLFSTEKNLRSYQGVLQTKLNKLETIVILPLSHLDENTLVENSLKNSLVFGSHSLEGLLIRVRELHTEGNRQMRVHHQNVHHLRRLHVDSIVLHHKLKSLNDQICSAMQRKFGDVIPLREIEEKTLSQTVFKLRTALGMIDPQASQIFQGKFTRMKEKLFQMTQEHSLKLNVCAVLESEKRRLSKILDKQAKKKTNLYLTENKNNLKKLMNVYKLEKYKIDTLKKELVKLNRKNDMKYIPYITNNKEKEKTENTIIEKEEKMKDLFLIKDKNHSLKKKKRNSKSKNLVALREHRKREMDWIDKKGEWQQNEEREEMISQKGRVDFGVESSEESDEEEEEVIREKVDLEFSILNEMILNILDNLDSIRKSSIGVIRKILEYIITGIQEADIEKISELEHLIAQTVASSVKFAEPSGVNDEERAAIRDIVDYVLGQAEKLLQAKADALQVDELPPK